MRVLTGRFSEPSSETTASETNFFQACRSEYSDQCPPRWLYDRRRRGNSITTRPFLTVICAGPDAKYLPLRRFRRPGTLRVRRDFDLVRVVTRDDFLCTFDRCFMCVAGSIPDRRSRAITLLCEISQLSPPVGFNVERSFSVMDRMLLHTQQRP